MSDQNPPETPGTPPPWQPPPYQGQQPQGGYPPQDPQYGQQYGQQYPQQPPGPPVPYPGYAAAAPTPGRATAALVVGIIGLLFCFVGSIVAWVLGAGAIKQIDASQGRLGGRGIAKAGMIIGIVGVVLWALFVAFFAVIVATGDCDSTSSDSSFSFNCS